ncbi:LysM peptidoglycan-binding domain-containing protein [Shewanella sp. SR44-3]|uniref:LysM peptidoglycan-binding domain-containing protein n=1 Tax=Shewanella sp. SR44-3 TaxID=2760936 RepID=UPI0015FAA319|nr:LysM peptidoglycan-binding domain-containing protein [Shewanella sp. SR44-3]MBB1269740.1 LysM peptidoglycan-binding domain-containing protein [Shewanella sp. SR44-3]
MDATMKRILLVIFLSLGVTQLHADTLALKSGHPDTYVVKKGDTLWDISGYFLNDPWRWPTLWGGNPHIANPHLIYPGDQLTLVFIDGQPRLVRNKTLLKKLVEGRVKSKNAAIPAVALSLIQPYLAQNRIVEKTWLEALPMVLGGESPSKHHIVGDIVYVDTNMPIGEKVAIYVPGREFFQASTDEPLGQEIILSASGRVVESGEISKIKLLTNLQETKVGFRVAPVEDQALMSALFMPKAAQLTEPTEVLAIEKDIREVGKLDVVYLDRGKADGIEPGHVFAIYRDGEKIVIGQDGLPVREIDRSSYDNLVAKFSNDRVYQVPDVFNGNVMVFKVFEKTSMALIMSNAHPVRVKDKLITPELKSLRNL